MAASKTYGIARIVLEGGVAFLPSRVDLEISMLKGMLSASLGTISRLVGEGALRDTTRRDIEERLELPRCDIDVVHIEPARTFSGRTTSLAAFAASMMSTVPNVRIVAYGPSLRSSKRIIHLARNMIKQRSDVEDDPVHQDPKPVLLALQNPEDESDRRVLQGYDSDTLGVYADVLLVDNVDVMGAKRLQEILPILAGPATSILMGVQGEHNYVQREITRYIDSLGD